ncbi:hypothetical protein ABI069_15095, partial [Enterococcus faecium]|uniref:hypothetical protein n=1 Tax=Enterococcus faecium TaxID=1352 RepID=UPI003F41F9FD
APDTSDADARASNWRRMGPTLKIQRWVRRLLSRRRVKAMLAARKAALEAEFFDSCATQIQQLWREHHRRRGSASAARQ